MIGLECRGVEVWIVTEVDCDGVWDCTIRAKLGYLRYVFRR